MTTYRKMQTRITTAPGRVLVDVEHDPRQSFSRAVYPAAMRAINTPAGIRALMDTSGVCRANIRAVELVETDDPEVTETFAGRPVWQGGPIDGTARSVSR